MGWFLVGCICGMALHALYAGWMRDAEYMEDWDDVDDVDDAEADPSWAEYQARGRDEP